MKPANILIYAVVMIFAAVPCAHADGLGIKAGVNISDLTNLESELIELGTKSGVAVGLFYRIDVTDSLSIQPEFLYMMKGVGDSGVTNGKEWSLSFDIDYLEFPILLKYRFPYVGKLEPNVFVGPYLAVKLTAKTEITVDEHSVSEDVEDIHSLDYGMVFGGGVDFELWSGHLVLDARYALGFRDVSTEGLERKTLHRVFTVMLGYCF